MKNLILLILFCCTSVPFMKGNYLIAQGGSDVITSDTITTNEIDIFSKTAVQLNFKIKGDKEAITYKIVGLTDEKTVIELESGDLNKKPLIRTIVDPKVAVTKVGVLIRKDNQNYYFTFKKDKKEINSVLELEHPEDYILGY